MRSKSESSEPARRLRKSQTEAEGLLWSLLRSKQLCGLKFRRQHPIGPFFADFACQSHHVVIELDGEYHDHIQENDLRREGILERQGWIGRKPKDSEEKGDGSRKAAAAVCPASICCRRCAALGIVGSNSLGLRPRLYAVATTWLETRNIKKRSETALGT